MRCVDPPPPVLLTRGRAGAAGGRGVLVGVVAAAVVAVGVLVRDGGLVREVHVGDGSGATVLVTEEDARRVAGQAVASGRDLDDAVLGTRTGAAGHDLDEPRAAPSPPASAPSGEVGGAELVASTVPVRGDAVWERLARCESSGDWGIATGNGYFGGLQFDDPTWREYGGTEFAPRADQATRAEQVLVATRVRDARGGYSAWPECSRRLGLPR